MTLEKAILKRNIILSKLQLEYYEAIENGNPFKVEYKQDGFWYVSSAPSFCFNCDWRKVEIKYSPWTMNYLLDHPEIIKHGIFYTKDNETLGSIEVINLFNNRVEFDRTDYIWTLAELLNNKVTYSIDDEKTKLICGIPDKEIV